MKFLAAFAIAFAALGLPTTAHAQEYLSGEAAIEACSKSFRHCVAAYEAYRDGIGVRADARKATEILEYACDRKAKRGQYFTLCKERADRYWDAGERDLAVEYSIFTCTAPQKATDALPDDAQREGCLEMMKFMSTKLAGVPHPWPNVYMIMTRMQGLRRWCDNGATEMCLYLGALETIFAEAPGSNTDPSNGMANLRRACDADHQIACSYMASLIAANEEKYLPGAGLMMYARACQLGKGADCNELDFDPAGMDSLALAERIGFDGIDPGLPAAQQFLAAGYAIENGYPEIGVAALRSLAFEHYQPALYRLGWMTLRGESGIEADDIAAAKLLARSKYPDAHYAAALVYNKYSDERNFVTQMTAAAFAGYPAAKEWYDAEQAAQRARSDAIGRQLREQTAQNRLAESQMMRSAIDRAMSNYYQPDGADDRVCANIIFGGRMTRECMAESTFDKYYRP